MNIDLFLTHLENGEFSKIFRYFRENNAKFKGYKIFEDEYALDNPTGTKLKQFKDRLTTFYNSCLIEEKQTVNSVGISDANQNTLSVNQLKTLIAQGKLKQALDPRVGVVVDSVWLLIAQGKLKQALDLLPDTNEFILQKARFSKLEHEERMGIITTSEANLERNRITHALLQMLDDDVVTTSPKPEMVNKITTDFAAIIKALNDANWADVIDLLDEHFGDNPTLQYNILKQTIESALAQGQQPNPATQQSLQMLINKLKKQ
jgi:hypothetical protein